jgi:hypothetical protein
LPKNDFKQKLNQNRLELHEHLSRNQLEKANLQMNRYWFYQRAEVKGAVGL